MKNFCYLISISPAVIRYKIEETINYFHQLSQIASRMHSINGLYFESKSYESGKPILSASVTKNSNQECNISLYQKHLVESNGKKVIPFDFDLKYSFTLQPPALTFERSQEKVQYLLKSQNDIQAWRQVLKGKLNQRGFHEQFKPKKKIGKGNFASVYLAQKLQDGKSYAVKAFSKEAAYSQDKGKECLIKQIEIMRHLNHKYCMKLHEVFQSDNSLYIVVELLDGGQLYDKVKGKYKFKSNEIRTIVFSILSGLKEMHSKKIMHRDLKPENLIFKTQNSFQCSIADFGLAEFADADEYLFVRCGTPGYVAPQVINIKDMKTKYHQICDIFSLGLIFHILLLGTSAFPGKTYNEVLAQNRASNINFESQEYQKIDQDAFNLMVKMLKKSPNERISAVEALNHPYFKNMETAEEEDDVVTELSNIKSSNSTSDSPLVLSNNPARKNDAIKKDSCIQFKMGKQNVFTGKMETLAETGATNNSVGKRFQSIVAPKVSKFTANQQLKK